MNLILHKSNIGKQPIILQNTSFFLSKQRDIFLIKGKLGIFQINSSEFFIFQISKLHKTLQILPKNASSTQISSLWGTYRSLISNSITGLNLGFVQNLELVGLGYKASAETSKVVFRLGKSHEVIYKLPEELTLKFFTNTFMCIRGIDLQQVRHVAFQIYKLKKPDVYKNKGIRLPQLSLIKKEGKKQK